MRVFSEYRYVDASCSSCGRRYSPDDPGGLCPRCLVGMVGSPTGETMASPPLEPGESFGRLKVIELCGRGGMGVVYRARHIRLDRIVALKVLPLELAEDPDFRERFQREARALAAMSHPNIVSVYDFGIEKEMPYLAMEYVDGMNLRQLILSKSLPSREALRIVPQLCDALEYAHGQGVIHRDIKPDNILLDKQGSVRIADFGLAKIMRGHGIQLETLTRPHETMGTPQYMAPEQIENAGEVDHRADIYSLGVVFYEMLTGELPIGRFAPPSQKTKIDDRVDVIVHRALEKELKKRYQAAGDVKTDVTRVGSARANLRARVRTARRLSLSSTAFCFISLFLTVGMVLTVRDPEIRPLHFSAQIASSCAGGVALLLGVLAMVIGWNWRRPLETIVATACILAFCWLVPWNKLPRLIVDLPFRRAVSETEVLSKRSLSTFDSSKDPAAASFGEGRGLSSKEN